MSKPAVLLLSGGLDSATLAAIAKADGYAVHALSFAYGQRHSVELTAARDIAASLKLTSHRVIDLDLRAFGGSALTADIDVPKHDSVEDLDEGIPITYVPARNTVFLSIALGLAEVMEASDIFIGVNAVDYSGYPDCRPEFIAAFEATANLATKAAVEGTAKMTLHTPLIDLSKADIIKRGTALGVDYAKTISCYDPNETGAACGRCDSCLLRRQGFENAGLPDPTRYQ
ncbi:MAG: 7-cyano-7-deazaguanine synthase QueC [Pseudomonadota bacterium]